LSDQFVIWGSSGHAFVIADLLQAQGGQVVATFDNDAAARPIADGIPLFIGKAGFDEWQRTAATRIARYVIAIGGARGADRLGLADFLESRGLTAQTVIATDASVARSAVVEPGAQVLARGIVAARATLGRQSIVNNGAQVDHECRVDAGVHLAPGAVLCGKVSVGSCAFIGAGSVVLPRLTIGAGATVGAGAVVTRDVPPQAVVAGNPARIISKA
jgi:sugar O-acyltransferase (sialic acid O-acetyltransferase NeuD family)